MNPFGGLAIDRRVGDPAGGGDHDEAEDGRLELVVSVVGLDVIDGKPGPFAKRGQVIAPGEKLAVKGWRRSPDRVLRFRFSSVSGSYANLRHGDHRNVGVIGLALFDEKGVDPWRWMPDEVGNRLSVSPL